MKEQIIIIEGVRISIKPPDIDGDGKTGGVETVQQHIQGVQEIHQESELGDVMKSLDSDVMNDERMSSIDSNAFLKEIEIPSMTGFETLLTAGLIPERWSALTRKKKRNSRSIDGFGSEQKVRIAVGDREQKAESGGFMGGLKGLFKRKEDNGNQ